MSKEKKDPLEVCPECGSKNVEYMKIFNEDCLVCRDCGYDEAKNMDLDISDDSSGKAKGKSRNVYRTGGGRRSVK